MQNWRSTPIGRSFVNSKRSHVVWLPLLCSQLPSFQHWYQCTNQPNNGLTKNSSCQYFAFWTLIFSARGVNFDSDKTCASYSSLDSHQTFFTGIQNLTIEKEFWAKINHKRLHWPRIGWTHQTTPEQECLNRVDRFPIGYCCPTCNDKLSAPTYPGLFWSRLGLHRYLSISIYSKYVRTHALHSIASFIFNDNSARLFCLTGYSRWSLVLNSCQTLYFYHRF